MNCWSAPGALVSERDLPRAPLRRRGRRGIRAAAGAYLEAQGTPIGHPDTQIAAIALANDLTVVTGNVRHFQRVPGLAVENWLE